MNGDDRMLVQLTVRELRALIRDEVQRLAGERSANDAAESWVDAEAIEKHFGVSRGTVHNWIRNEACPHEMRGKIIRFKMSAVEAWFARRDAPNSKPGKLVRRPGKVTPEALAYLEERDRRLGKRD